MQIQLLLSIKWIAFIILLSLLTILLYDLLYVVCKMFYIKNESDFWNILLIPFKIGVEWICMHLMSTWCIKQLFKICPKQEIGMFMLFTLFIPAAFFTIYMSSRIEGEFVLPMLATRIIFTFIISGVSTSILIFTYLKFKIKNQA